MKLPLAEIRVAADRAFVAGRYEQAIASYRVVLSRAPDDYQARLWVADALTRLGRGAEAVPVYRATAKLCIDGGRPLVAIVACRALEAMGAAAPELLAELVEVHGRGSSRVGEVGARLSPHYEDLTINDRELKREREAPDVLAQAVLVASDLSQVGELPTAFPPMPILGTLDAQTMARVVPTLIVHRLPAGHVLIRAGERGESCYLIATGRLRVVDEDDTGAPRELATVAGGSVVGEMALISGAPRLATVEVIEPADVLEIGREALAAIGDGLDELAPVLDKMAHNRWMKNLLEQSPLFRIFERDQRRDLLRRCSAHEVPQGTVLVAEGEMARGLYMLLRGEIELARRVEGGDPVVARLAAGAVVGVESLIEDRPSEASAKTIAPSTILFLSKRFVRRLLGAVPEFVVALHQVAQHRQRQTRPPA